eukprot:403348291
MSNYKKKAQNLKNQLGETITKVKNSMESESSKNNKEKEIVHKQNQIEEFLEKIKSSDEKEQGKLSSEQIEINFREITEKLQDQLDSDHLYNNRLIQLPWWGLDLINNRKGVEQLVKAEILKLSTDIDKLTITDLDYDYQFDFDRYLYIAQILMSIDSNLKNLKEKLVPSIINNEEIFWRNYFYQIEIILMELGLCSKLGKAIIKLAKNVKDSENRINKHQNKESKQPAMQDKNQKGKIQKQAEPIETKESLNSKFIDICNFQNQKVRNKAKQINKISYTQQNENPYSERTKQKNALLNKVQKAQHNKIQGLLGNHDPKYKLKSVCEEKEKILKKLNDSQEQDLILSELELGVNDALNYTDDE